MRRGPKGPKSRPHFRTRTRAPSLAHPIPQSLFPGSPCPFELEMVEEERARVGL